MKYIRNSNGFTIVEVAAGFVILAIILMSFMGILVQTKITNAASEKIQDATYVAQAEMEALYLIASSRNSLQHLDSPILTTSTTTYTKNNERSDVNLLQCVNYSGATGPAIEKRVSYEGVINNHSSQLEIKLTCRPQNNIVGTVILELTNQVDVNKKIKIENTYTWR